MARIKPRKTYSVSRRRRLGGRLKLAAGLLGLLIMVMLILELTNTTHVFHKAKIPPVIPLIQKSAPATTSSKSASPNSVAAVSQSTPTTTKTPPSTGSSSSPLVAPYGTFVSNHMPGQDGSTTAEQSACDTTPRATCYIKFTNGSTTTQLPGQTVDSDGSTIWDWDIQDASLTSGKWQVTAVASLDGQTLSTADQIPLEVQ